MNLEQYEPIELSNQTRTNDNQIITMKEALLMKMIWPAKYESYGSKDKLKILKGNKIFFEFMSLWF